VEGRSFGDPCRLVPPVPPVAVVLCKDDIVALGFRFVVGEYWPHEERGYSAGWMAQWKQGWRCRILDFLEEPHKVVVVIEDFVLSSLLSARRVRHLVVLYRDG
jgi:hypothetical protein